MGACLQFIILYITYDETSELGSEGLIGEDRGTNRTKLRNRTEKKRRERERERVGEKNEVKKTKAWKRFASGELNRFHPISDAVNSNQRSFPFRSLANDRTNY